jgi:hypothetical protein
MVPSGGNGSKLVNSERREVSKSQTVDRVRFNNGFSDFLSSFALVPHNQGRLSKPQVSTLGYRVSVWVLTGFARLVLYVIM